MYRFTWTKGLFDDGYTDQYQNALRRAGTDGFSVGDWRGERRRRAKAPRGALGKRWGVALGIFVAAASGLMALALWLCFRR